MTGLSPAARRRLATIRARAAQGEPKRLDPPTSPTARPSALAPLTGAQDAEGGPCGSDGCSRTADYLVATGSGVPDRRCARCTRQATMSGAYATPIGDRP